jgi:hypothetical protein
VSELDAISECSTCGENRIAEAHSAQSYAQIDIGRGTAVRDGVGRIHFIQKNITKRLAAPVCSTALF